jgi:hypothetical protein
MTRLKLKFRPVAGLALALSFLLAGCNDFNEGKTRNIIEYSPVRLDAEQVMLNAPQLDCGVREELWDAPVQINEGVVRANLTARGRALKFDDDVSVAEPGYRHPFVQIRGEFPLGVIELINAKDGPEKDTKLVDLNVGVKIDHVCFPNPLPILGLRKGKFTDDAPPRILFRLDNGWQLEKFVH